MSEIGFTGDMRGGDPRIEAIMFSLLFISNDREKSPKIGKLLQVSEEFEEEEADGVIGMASHGGVG